MRKRMEVARRSSGGVFRIVRRREGSRRSHGSADGAAHGHASEHSVGAPIHAQLRGEQMIVAEQVGRKDTGIAGSAAKPSGE